MGRITDDIHEAVTASVASATRRPPPPPPARGGGGGDFRSWPVTVGLMMALGGAVGALVTWVRTTDEQQRAVAVEATRQHDLSAMSHTDIRGRLALAEDRIDTRLSELRERVIKLEERAARRNEEKGGRR